MSLPEIRAAAMAGPVQSPKTNSLSRRVFAPALAGAWLALTSTGVYSESVTNHPLPPRRLPPPPPPKGAASASDLADWAHFAGRFITPEGRIVDTGNAGVSHSEGQGYGLLLAEWAGDRAMFERILRWTMLNLQRQGDRLFAWRWQPNQMVHVQDRNSASDGDLLIAWALLRAAERWDMPQWAAQSGAIADDILRLCTRELDGRLYLLPGPVGFVRSDRITINPSYYIFPAIRALGHAGRDERWARLDHDGLEVLARSSFGQWNLPADWVDVWAGTGVMRPALEWAARFSWDAVRVPLNLAWARERTAPALNAAATFWAQQGSTVQRTLRIPAWSDLRNNRLSSYTGHAGIQAVAALSLTVAHGGSRRVNMPAQAAAPHYYAAALAMLVRVAWQEAGATA